MQRRLSWPDASIRRPDECSAALRGTPSQAIVTLLRRELKGKIRMQSSYASVNGVTLHYVTMGDGELILFLHGFPEFWYAWQGQLAMFGEEFRAVAVDMRGFNLSSKPLDVTQYQINVLVEDVRA